MKQLQPRLSIMAKPGPAAIRLRITEASSRIADAIGAKLSPPSQRLRQIHFDLSEVAFNFVLDPILKVLDSQSSRQPVRPKVLYHIEIVYI